jgi:hypothetical protein
MGDAAASHRPAGCDKRQATMPSSARIAASGSVRAVEIAGVDVVRPVRDRFAQNGQRRCWCASARRPCRRSLRSSPDPFH